MASEVNECYRDFATVVPEGELRGQLEYHATTTRRIAFEITTR